MDTRLKQSYPRFRPSDRTTFIVGVRAGQSDVVRASCWLTVRLKWHRVGAQYGVAAMNAPTAKQKILQAVENLPDNATLEDAIERLCFLAKVEEGLRQSTVGEVVSHQDAVRQLLG